MKEKKQISWKEGIFLAIGLTLFLRLFYLYQFKGGQLFSVSRHALIFFPMFMFLANLKIGKITEVIYFACSILLLNMFFIFYTFGFFVA